LLGHPRGLGFRACLDHGALYLADTTGWRRDVFRFVSPRLVFEVLNAGLDDGSFQGTSPAERATARHTKLTPRWELAMACM
jgi:hypothetical protein